MSKCRLLLPALCVLIPGNSLKLQVQESQKLLAPRAISTRLSMSDRPAREKAPRVHLVTFASGADTYKASARRLASEANATNLFDGIYSYTDFPEFILSDKKWEQHLQARKGLGYWFWKGPLISNILNQIDDGDVLVYADSGCEIGNANKFEDIAKDLCDHDIVTFSLKPMQERRWTKGDVFSEFSVTPDDGVYAHSAQILATYFYMKNTPQTRQFIKHWEDLMSNYHLVSDEPSTTKSASNFKMHRQDQSLFSMLIKANQPDCHTGRCSKHHPRAPNKHEKYGIPGLRPLIRDDPGYPPKFENALIMATRTRNGQRQTLQNPPQLTDEEVSIMKRQVNACK